MSWRKTFRISITIVTSTGILLMLAGMGSHWLLVRQKKPGLWQQTSDPFGPPSFEVLLSLCGLLMIAVGVTLALLDLGFWMRQVKRKRAQ
jgi:hypothetical protein